MLDVRASGASFSISYWSQPKWDVWFPLRACLMNLSLSWQLQKLFNKMISSYKSCSQSWTECSPKESQYILKLVTDVMRWFPLLALTFTGKWEATQQSSHRVHHCHMKNFHVLQKIFLGFWIIPLEHRICTSITWSCEVRSNFLLLTLKKIRLFVNNLESNNQKVAFKFLKKSMTNEIKCSNLSKHSND